jgi:hypothetical protein
MDVMHIAEQTASALVGWRLVRLRAFLDGPLAIVATGNTLALATLWARLHETTGRPAWSLTPADFRQRPLPTGTRVLLLSATGRHHDILGAARHAARPGTRIHAVVHDGSAPLCDLVRAGGGDVTVLPPPPPPADLADPWVGIPMLVLAGTVYGLGPVEQVFVPAVHPDPPTTRPGFVLALGAGLASPAAQAFATRCRESGFCMAAAGDRRNVTHGDLMPIDPSVTWLVHFALPDDAPRLAAYDQHLPVMATTRLVCDATGVTGAISLFLKGSALFRAAVERFDCRPTTTTLPDWIKALYRLAEEQP